MKAYVYGEKRDLPAGFETFSDRAHTAIVSIDMHEGHLADTPDCPCPAPRAREIVAPIDAFHDQVRALGRADHPRQDRAPEGRRRRREGRALGVAADLPALCRRHPQRRRACDRGLALDGAGDAGRAGRHGGRHEEAAVGVLPDRPRLPAQEHGRPHRGARRRVHRLLRARTPPSTRRTSTTAWWCSATSSAAPIPRWRTRR